MVPNNRSSVFKTGDLVLDNDLGIFEVKDDNTEVPILTFRTSEYISSNNIP